MNKLFKVLNPYYIDNNFVLLKGDVLDRLKEIKTSSVDLIFADPPYFLSNNGVTCRNGKMVSVNKGEWDKSISHKTKYLFNKRWIRMCKRILKDNGSIWICGTLHNIYSIGQALEECSFKILNNITWQKTNPPPNLGCRVFTHSTETVLWARKDNKNAKHTFNYLEMKKENDNKQMKDVWISSTTSKREKVNGKHPTQKPEWLLDRIIKSGSNEGDVILDPFNGSGTTGVTAFRNGRKYIGIDLNKDYLDITIKRYKGDKNEKRI